MFGVPESLLRSDQPWWENLKRISGVFEGGGAKGVLYAGALRALRADGRWFDAVAGASAGAITAALVAAGMKPEEIEQEMEKALDCLKEPRWLNGILRVRKGGSYLHQEALLKWLADVLESKLGDPNVTFEQLHKRHEPHGIELNVVAVDLNREWPVVFNWLLTPRCQIAHAVVASAAIPVIFEWMPLIISNKRLGLVVDGGVAANFPAFVFTDESFRKMARLPPRGESPVVGFLLDEGDDLEASDYRDQYREATFSRPLTLSGLDSPLFKTRGFKPRTEPSSVGRRLWLPIRLLLWPVLALLFRLWPWLLAKNAGAIMEFENWSRIGNPGAQRAAVWLDRVLIGTQPWAFFIGGCTVITLALGYSLYDLGIKRGLIGLYTAITSGDAPILWGIAFMLVIFLAISAVIYGWVILMVFFVGASIIHRSTRMIGYGLARTFLKGPGAPPWAGEAESDRVVRLKVPDGIKTLGIDEKTMLAKAITEAEQSTIKQLEDLFPKARPTRSGVDRRQGDRRKS